MFDAILKAKIIQACVRSPEGSIIAFGVLTKDSAKRLVMELKAEDVNSLRFDIGDYWLWIG